MLGMQRLSLSDVAYTQVRRKILFHELRAGDPVNEASLARQFELGRTPIREAVLRLAREGLLRIIPRKGIIVTELNIDTLRLVFEARSPCEAQIARLAALRRESADIESMEKALSGVEQMIEERRFRDLLEADERFHMALADAAKNPLLREMISTLYGLGIRFWYATLAQRPPSDISQEMSLHREVLEGVKVCDCERTAQAMLAIISGFPDRVAGLIRGDQAQLLLVQTA
jgi:DNA-binding GntR family transcriptional regulator